MVLGRILSLLRGRPALVTGTGKLAEGSARKIELGDPLAGTGRQIVLCRVGGRIYALDAACPHEGGRIADGPLVEGRYATCPLHHYQFDPATGVARNAACRKARTYRVRERGGDAEIWA